jgi:single-strand DNA-binding protein
MSINKAIVVGNLGRDPEIRALPSGQSVASFSIATTARFKDRNGEPQERTEWHRVVAFGRLADNCQRLLAKGSQVYIEGRLNTRQYQAKDGTGLRYGDVSPNRRISVRSDRGLLRRHPGRCVARHHGRCSGRSGGDGARPPGRFS